MVLWSLVWLAVTVWGQPAAQEFDGQRKLDEPATSLQDAKQFEGKYDPQAELEPASHTDEIARLSGMPAVAVLVADSQAWKSNESKRLHTAIETRLRERGVPMAVKKTKSPSFLMCAVSYRRIADLVLLRVVLEMHEEVTINRNKKEFITRVWESQVVPYDEPVTEIDFERVKQRVLEGIDEFCNDYFAANPKQP